MNKLLVAIFGDEAAAGTGLDALRRLHDAGDITLYATSVLVSDSRGLMSVAKSFDTAPAGTVTGLALGGLIGLLGGPVGLAIGAATGTLVGAVRDFQASGVGLDLIEEARSHLVPGKVALVAEIDEEWVIPVDAAIESAGGQTFRRTRRDLEEALFEGDVADFRAEIEALESEASDATAAAKTRLTAKLDAAKKSLDGAVHRAQQQVEKLKQEAYAKADLLRLQLGQAKGEAKARIEDRIKQVNSTFHARNARLSQAWSRTVQALGAA